MSTADIWGDVYVHRDRRHGPVHLDELCRGLILGRADAGAVTLFGNRGGGRRDVMTAQLRRRGRDER